MTHYDLELHYTPPAPAPAPLEGTLDATATISLTPTQDLDRFNLDLRGLTATVVTVDGKSMDFTQDGNELVITPRPRLKTGRAVEVVVEYGGTTTRPTDIEGALYGWVTMRDGAMVANEPEGSSTWFPVNDHPQDKATYEFDITVPDGLVAVANGILVDQQTSDGWTTWSWDAPDQMAAYLATASVGNYDLRTYSATNGVPIIDAVDEDLPRVLGRLHSISASQVGSLTRERCRRPDIRCRGAGVWPCTRGGCCRRATAGTSSGRGRPTRMRATTRGRDFTARCCPTSPCSCCS